ncbi:MAG: 50S ribosomal protein L6 [Bacteroidales bacterium]|nr:50S ribosomal protein L6 [Bacteroidales bacterium]
MSRIGKLPVNLPAGVTAELLDGNVVKVKGPLGEMCQKVDSDIEVTIEGTEIKFTRPTDQPRHRSMHGLYRALVNNMVVGVSKGFQTEQEFVGVGYRVEVAGKLVTFSVGYSHSIQLMLPAEVTAETPQVKKGENPKLVLKSCDKQLLGQVAAKVRSFRKPEPYKGKGIKFVGEQLRRKAGKSASAK